MRSVWKRRRALVGRRTGTLLGLGPAPATVAGARACFGEPAAGRRMQAASWLDRRTRTSPGPPTAQAPRSEPAGRVAGQRPADRASVAVQRAQHPAAIGDLGQRLPGAAG